MSLPLGGLGPDEVAPLDKQVIRRLYEGTGGHPLYLRTVLSEGWSLQLRLGSVTRRDGPVLEEAGADGDTHADQDQTAEE